MAIYTLSSSVFCADRKKFFLVSIKLPKWGSAYTEANTLFWSLKQGSTYAKGRDIHRDIYMYGKSHEFECISWFMGASDVLKFSKLHEPKASAIWKLQNITSDHKSILPNYTVTADHCTPCSQKASIARQPAASPRPSKSITLVPNPTRPNSLRYD